MKSTCTSPSLPPLGSQATAVRKNTQNGKSLGAYYYSYEEYMYGTCRCLGRLVHPCSQATRPNSWRVYSWCKVWHALIFTVLCSLTFHFHALPQRNVFTLLWLHILRGHILARPRTVEPLTLRGKGRLSLGVCLGCVLARGPCTWQTSMTLSIHRILHM